MASFYYCDQNPSGFCFLVQISAFVNLDLAGIAEFKCERKNEKNSDANGLLELFIALLLKTLWNS